MRSDDQVTIFDVLPNEDLPDFKTMSEEQIIEQISLMTGLVFKPVKFSSIKTTVYRAIEDNSGVDIHLSKYVFEERKGEPFIACDVWRKNGNEGCGVPCESIEEVVATIRKNLY